MLLYSFFFIVPPTTPIYTLSLHDALPISLDLVERLPVDHRPHEIPKVRRVSHFHLGEQREHPRSEEHTSELQSHHDLVCRLLLEKKKKNKNTTYENTRQHSNTTQRTYKQT